MQFFMLIDKMYLVIKMKKIIIDARYEKNAQKQWGSKYEIIPSFCCEKIAEPVAYHPDMSLCKIGDTFISCPESYDYYKNIFGKNLIKGKTELLSHYPYDIAYNVMVYQDIALGKEEFLDSVVKDELERQGIKLINVNQGYAKCSCAVAKEGIITADDGIYNELVKYGVNALKITPGYVELAGYDCGFIGGATGEIDGVLTFFGDVSAHPDFEKIRNFCKISYIKDFPLTDVGTFLCI